MGVENNEVVIATTWNDKFIESAKEFINTVPDVFKKLFVIIPSIANGKNTVILGPDGSKKGWKTAEKGEELRELFIEFLESNLYEDSSNCWQWVEVGYGEFGQKVLRGNCHNLYDNNDYCCRVE